MLCGIDNIPQNTLGYFPHSVWMWEIVCEILSIPWNIVMDLNNVMCLIVKTWSILKTIDINYYYTFWVITQPSCFSYEIGICNGTYNYTSHPIKQVRRKEFVTKNIICTWDYRAYSYQLIYPFYCRSMIILYYTLFIHLPLIIATNLYCKQSWYQHNIAYDLLTPPCQILS